MKNYFIHIDNDFAKAEVFSYGDSISSHHPATDMDEIRSHVDPNSKAVVFLPSNMIRCIYSKKETNESEEQFEARFFSEHEDDLITDVSSNRLIFSEENNLALVVEKSIIDPLNDLLNQIGCDVEIYPEYFLHQALDQDTCLFINGRYSFSFADGSGFCAKKESFNDYLDLVTKERKNFKPIFMAFDGAEASEFKQTDCKEVSLEALHRDFLTAHSKKSNLPSMFESKFNIQGTLRRFNFERRDLIYSFIVISSLLILPLVNIALMQSYKKSYEEKTFSIFTELNPNFRRIVNSRAQMDQLLLAINSNETKPLDLNVLGYLRAIPIDEIASSNIDFDNSNVTLEFDRMSSMKYSIIDNLIEQSNTRVIKNDIENTDGAFSGSLVLEIGSD